MCWRVPDNGSICASLANTRRNHSSTLHFHCSWPRPENRVPLRSGCRKNVNIPSLDGNESRGDSVCFNRLKKYGIYLWLMSDYQTFIRFGEAREPRNTAPLVPYQWDKSIRNTNVRQLASFVRIELEQDFLWHAELVDSFLSDFRWEYLVRIVSSL